MQLKNSMSFAFIDYLGVFALYTPQREESRVFFRLPLKISPATLNRLFILHIQGIGYSEKVRPNPLVQNTASLILVAILLFFLVLIWHCCAVSGLPSNLSPAHDILFWDQIIQTDQSHFFVLRRIFFGFLLVSISCQVLAIQICLATPSLKTPRQLSTAFSPLHGVAKRIRSNHSAS